jgi:hypothetical protein
VSASRVDDSYVLVIKTDSDCDDLPNSYGTPIIKSSFRYHMELEQESRTELKVFERFNSNPGPLLVSISERAQSAQA